MKTLGIALFALFCGALAAAWVGLFMVAPLAGLALTVALGVFIAVKSGSLD